MSDIIKLLPDSVANQIAAGEVVQRPASAVKELLENAVDAGATKIELIIKDAGRTLIQVIDNGKGMSETDARMCFERHATSKIKNADDLFNIQTKGFRGEALASIAAIAMVELVTKQKEDTAGTKIHIEGSKFVSQESCAANNGTSISIKNLFYNVPARRNFLKSNNTEFRQIVEELQRVSLPHPEIAFTLYNNDQEVLSLYPGTLKQRIVALFGKSYNEKLAPVDETTDIVSISGFIGKPEASKKSRSDQYFFINNRYIRNPYLHYAVLNAYQGLIAADMQPVYFIFFSINPKNIDINIHPTKTEVKFEDERLIYSILRSAVKRSLGKYNFTPTIDFDKELSFDIAPAASGKIINPPGITVNPSYNPFNSTSQYSNDKKKSDFEKHFNRIDAPEENESSTPLFKHDDEEKSGTIPFLHLQNKYIACSVKSGLMIIDRQAAHERILFERTINYLKNASGPSQQLLFPIHTELNSADFVMFKELIPDLKKIGFDLSEFGRNTIIIHGAPPELSDKEIKIGIDKFIEDYNHNLFDLKLQKHDNIARTFAKQHSIKPGKELSNAETNKLVNELFSCEQASVSIDSNNIISYITVDELNKIFNK